MLPCPSRTGNPSEEPGVRMTTRNVLFVLLCAVLPLWTMTNGEEPNQKDSKNAKAPQETAQVTVVIDYGDGVEKHFTRIAWKDGLTILEAMRAAQGHPRGIRFEFKGNGASAFL